MNMGTCSSVLPVPFPPVQALHNFRFSVLFFFIILFFFTLSEEKGICNTTSNNTRCPQAFNLFTTNKARANLSHFNLCSLLLYSHVWRLSILEVSSMSLRKSVDRSSFS